MQGLSAKELEYEFFQNKFKKKPTPKKIARIPRDPPQPPDTDFLVNDRIVRFESEVTGTSALESAGFKKTETRQYAA